MSKRSKPSVWSKAAQNRYSDNFAGRLIPLLESPAYRALSLAAHRVLSRIEVEFGHHGGNPKENGKLPVTYKQFHEYGVDSKAIAPALSELEALGFIEITKHWLSSDNFKSINWYRLTYRPAEGVPSDGSHEWRRIADAETAEAVAKQARETSRNSGLRRHKPLGRNCRGEPAPTVANPSGSAGFEPNGKPNGKIYSPRGKTSRDCTGENPPRQALKALNPLDQNGVRKHAPTRAIARVSRDLDRTAGKLPSRGKTPLPSRSRVETVQTGPMALRAIRWPDGSGGARPPAEGGGSILAKFRRRCAFCGASTKSQRSTARFCSAACRQAAHYRRRNSGVRAATTENREGDQQ